MGGAINGICGTALGTDDGAAAFSCLSVLEVLTGGIFGKTAGVEKGICAGRPAEAGGGGFEGDLSAADA